MKRTAGMVGIGLLSVGIGLAACGGSAKETSSTAVTAVATTAPTASSAPTTAPSTTTATKVTTAPSSTVTVATTAAPTTATTAAASGKVSANTASAAELQAAFEANGISNAAKWAKEVQEYRPYAAADTTFTSLRKELAKYNPGADVLEKIIATLKPCRPSAALDVLLPQVSALIGWGIEDEMRKA